MATSGSVNFTVNRDKLIKLALKGAGKLENEETPESSEITDASDLLNIMLKTFQSEGLKLWLRKKATVFLKKATNQYSLSSTGAHAAYSYTRTQIKVAASATNTSIDVDSTSGMSAADFIGFELDDGTSYWTTVTSVTDTDTVVIPSPGITSAAAVDNYVYFFTTKIDRPFRILQAFVRDSDSNDTPVSIISQKDYTDLSNKTVDGQVTQIHYDPQTSSGVLYVWPETDDVTDTLEVIVQRPIEDMDSATNDFDVPAEWYEAILYGLMEMAGIHYQIPDSMMRRISVKAQSALNKAIDGDVENTSIFISPDIG